MQKKRKAFKMTVVVKVIHPVGIKEGAPAFYTMYFVSFFEQEFGQIGTILPRYSGYKGFFHFMQRYKKQK
jgi:hypothetical protein